MIDLLSVSLAVLRAAESEGTNLAELPMRDYVHHRVES